MVSLKQTTQTLLKRLGLYHRVVESVLYDCYWRVADRRVLQKRNAEVEFYRSLLTGLKRGDLIFDIGANYGSKTDVFLRLGAQVVAVEPDKFNQAVLKDKFLAWRLKRKPVIVVGKAVGDRSAIATMWVDAPGSAKNTLSEKWVDTLRKDEQRFSATVEFAQKAEVEVLTLDALITTYGQPFYIKIDVEGFEPWVIRGLHRPVKFLSFEVNLPEFLPEGLECIELLALLSRKGEFNYSAACGDGLKSESWLSKANIIKALNASKDRSVEVFWRA